MVRVPYLRGLGSGAVRCTVVRCWSELKKEHSPTRNQLTGKSHEEKSKNSKTQNPHYRSTAQACRGNGRSRTGGHAFRAGPTCSWEQVALVSGREVFLYCKDADIDWHLDRVSYCSLAKQFTLVERPFSVAEFFFRKGQRSLPEPRRRTNSAACG